MANVENIAIIFVLVAPGRCAGLSSLLLQVRPFSGFRLLCRCFPPHWASAAFALYYQLASTSLRRPLGFQGGRRAPAPDSEFFL